MAIEPRPWRPQETIAGDSRLDIREYVRMLRRRWWLAALVLVACLGASIGATALQRKQYTSCTRLFVGQQTISQQELQFAQGLTQTSLALVKSYSEAIKALPVAQDAVSKLQLTDDPQEILDRVVAAPVGDTQIIRMCYTDHGQQRSADVANALADSFIAAIRRIDQSVSGEPAVKVSVLEPAVQPRKPSSPKPLVNGAAGLLLGATLAWTIVLLVERFDSTVKGRHDVEEIAGLPVLSLVPNMSVTKGRLAVAAGTPAAESYGLLRTAIRFMSADDPVKTLMVTSPESGDGKTTTAANLAAAFAENGAVTILVEADMRKPSLAGQFRIDGRSGLSNYLTGSLEFKELVHRTPRRNLFVAPAGPTPNNPAELLGGERMGKLLRALARQADIVIIDTPPVLAVADAMALTPMIDAAVVVVRGNKTGKEHLAEAMRIMQGVGAPILGVVVNGLSTKDGYYGYGYYGGQTYGQPSQRQIPSTTEHFETFAEPANGNGHAKTQPSRNLSVDE